jgi:hypothetical protein
MSYLEAANRLQREMAKLLAPNRRPVRRRARAQVRKPLTTPSVNAYIEVAEAPPVRPTTFGRGTCPDCERRGEVLINSKDGPRCRDCHPDLEVRDE